MLTILVLIQGKPGKGEALGAALTALLAPTRAEQGCISYDAHRSDEDYDLWMMYENWESQEAFETHLSMPHVEAFLETKMPALCVGDIRVQRFKRV